MRFFALIVLISLSFFPAVAFATNGAPVPLLKADHGVDWWFVFKFNAQSFPGCPGQASRQCPFGGKVENYPAYSQQFIFASSENHALQQGDTCAGTTTRDPVGATFSEIYNGSYYYVVWNDKFFDDPVIKGCKKKCQKPWGHLKGMLAWNDDGAGVVMQVSTADWPASGSKDHPRPTDGNTLGCIRTDNDVNASEHFFALKLNHDDITKVLKALGNASAVTDPENSQIVRNGGPADIQALVKNLGVVSYSTHYAKYDLSGGVKLISKASRLHVPPWQMISAILGGAPLRAATWWTGPKIPTTTSQTPVECWDDSLGKPGPVEIATSGTWAGKKIGLIGGPGLDVNHAKVGVSTSGAHHYVIFSDMNQQGSLTGNCGNNLSGRGGLTFIIDDKTLSDDVGRLIQGETAPSE